MGFQRNSKETNEEPLIEGGPHGSHVNAFRRQLCWDLDVRVRRGQSCAVLGAECDSSRRNQPTQLGTAFRIMLTCLNHLNWKKPSNFQGGSPLDNPRSVHVLPSFPVFPPSIDPNKALFRSHVETRFHATYVEEMGEAFLDSKLCL